MKYTHPALNDPYTSKILYLYVDGHYKVCPVCKGYGTIFRRDLDENNLIEMMKEDADYEGLENYRNRDYDQKCPECEGQRVVFMPDLPEWAEKAIQNWNESIRESEHIARQERMAGA